MPNQDRESEVAFCAEVKSWADALFTQHPEWPFSRAHIERYPGSSSKRQDLRILDREHGTPILSGEVKLPGTVEGRSPYDPVLVRDAFTKADGILCNYFFTWNVNTLVLFDRTLSDRFLIERRVEWWDLQDDLGFELTDKDDCALPEVKACLRDKFLPRVFGRFAEILAGADWGRKPDEIFLHSLGTYLAWPVIGTREYLAQECAQDKRFAGRLQRWMADEMQWTFDPTDHDNWRKALDRAARTLCYVFSNRAIFYKGVQRFSDRLKSLEMPRGPCNAEGKYLHFRRQFKAAVEATGDYEPVFFPEIDDWAGSLVFASPKSCLGWKGYFVNLLQYNFDKIPSDILGGIFQRLISPDERQKFGQFFTHQDIVDVINAFCIRRAGDVVLDPACGSGSFLVRAYHRKAWLSGQGHGGRRHQDHEKSHQELLREIYGCDIALFPAHLATLNMASRQVMGEENFPLIRRGNFFEAAEAPERFCSIPGDRRGDTRLLRPVPLVELDAVVGNPPYVRQEAIDKRSELTRARGETERAFESRLKNTKEFFQELLLRLWPGLRLSGRADLHCYFWPVAARFLKQGGHFGFLTSSSWLDVEYGFALQGWILQNYKLVAVLESVDEPWFADARIKTAATILQRCSDKAARDANLVRFVRLQRPLGEILGDRGRDDEAARQAAAERLRQLIVTSTEFEDDRLRIISVPQARLWQEGVQAGRLLAKAGALPMEGPEETEEGIEEERDEPAGDSDNGQAVRDWNGHADHYAAGKWGRFLRAPDIYFRIMRDYGSRFVKLGQIADIRFGIKSGCDAFFMPRDVTEQVLSEVHKGLPWHNVGLLAPATLAEVESGKVRIVRAGDNTLHPIETEYLRPEVHSLMQVDRPVVRAADTNRVVLWVNKELKDLAGTYVAKYIRWGARKTFAPKRQSGGKAKVVPERSTCAARPVWYDLTTSTNGVAFWPMTQKYRHIVGGNPDGLVCNHRLFYVIPKDLSGAEASVLVSVLNSTFVAMLKHFYGRYAGAEGTLDTEVVDCMLIEVPDTRGVGAALARRFGKAYRSLCKREVTHLVEEELLDCHTTDRLRDLLGRDLPLPKELRQPDRQELDDCVLELIGVTDPRERRRMLDELYSQTVGYYRYLRTQDIQSMENRAGGQRRLTAEDVAASIWDSLSDSQKGPPLTDWLKTLQADRRAVHIPDGKAKALGKGDMFSPAGVDYAQGKTIQHETYAHPEQAALAAMLANLEIRGEVELPAVSVACVQWRRSIERRLADARTDFDALAASRTGTDTLRDAAAGLLMQWFLHGRR